MTHGDNHHFLVNKLLSNSMTKIYFFQAILTFVKSLVGIFIPIYLFSIGFSLSWVLFYLMMFSITFILIMPVAVKLIRKLGFKYTILLTIPIYLLHLIIINYVQTYPWLFHLGWLTIGINNGIFWPTFHSEISQNSHKKNRSSEIGTLQVIATMVAMIAPLLGGILLDSVGYFSLLIISLILMIIASVPLILSEDIKSQKINFQYKDYVRLFRDKSHVLSKRAFFFEGIEHVLTLSFWPIILFILFENSFSKLGFLFTLVSIISVMFIVYFKSYLDSHKKENVLKFITKFFSFSWFIRSLITVVGGLIIYFIEAIIKLFVEVFRLTYNSMFYNNANKSQRFLDYIILRELYLHSSRILFILFSIIILYIFGERLEIFSLLILAGIISAFGVSSFKEE